MIFVFGLEINTDLLLVTSLDLLSLDRNLDLKKLDRVDGIANLFQT